MVFWYRARYNVRGWPDGVGRVYYLLLLSFKTQQTKSCCQISEIRISKLEREQEACNMNFLSFLFQNIFFKKFLFKKLEKNTSNGMFLSLLHCFLLPDSLKPDERKENLGN